MNVVQKRVAKSTKKLGVKGASSNANINFYDDVPNFELSLDDFEQMALARLKVLRKIEELKIRNISGDSYAAQLHAAIKSNLADPKVDSASHFILRAAYSRTEDLRIWFLRHEGYLLAHRLSHFSGKNLSALLQQMNLKPVPPTEKESLREHLLSVQGTTLADFSTSHYFAIPFTQALELVSTRRCYVHKGSAYVPESKVHTIVLAKFRTHLSRSLALAAAAFHRSVDEEARIAPLLKTMHQQMSTRNVVTSDFAGDAEVSAKTIDGLLSHMPLCMRQLHSGLKRDHKLKHWGRLQYGLFLKGAGMSMEDSLLFFQREFTKIMTSEQFNKNYAYNIRHMYGMEGKRASYTPYNCKKIILGTQPPGTGEHHGCPFRHYDDANLGSLLSKLQIGAPTDRKEMVRLAKQANSPNLACLKHFELTHPKAATLSDVSMNDIGNHPNAWFAASLSYSSIAHGNARGNNVTPEKSALLD